MVVYPNGIILELPPGPGRLVVLFFLFFFDPWNQPAYLCLRPSTLGKAPPVTPPPQDTSGLLHLPLPPSPPHLDIPLTNLPSGHLKPGLPGKLHDIFDPFSTLCHL